MRFRSYGYFFVQKSIKVEPSVHFFVSIQMIKLNQERGYDMKEKDFYRDAIIEHIKTTKDNSFIRMLYAMVMRHKDKAGY